MTPRCPLRFLAVLLLAVSFAPSPAAAQAPLAGGRMGRAERLHASGQALVAAGHRVSAMSYFRRAIQVDPAFAPAYVALAQAYLDRTGRAGQGERDALEVIEIGRRRRGDHVELGLLHARVLERLDRLDDAADVLRELATASPSAAAVHSLRAANASRRGAWSEALASYRAILRLADEGSVPDAVREEAERHAAALRLLAAANDVTQLDCQAPVRRALCAARLR